MCSCETNYKNACVRQHNVWQLYHQWYDRATSPTMRRDTKTYFQLFFKDYPDILKGIREGKHIKVMLYSKLREETQLRLCSSKRMEWHRRFNLIGSAFYKKTKVSPTFLFRKVTEYLGKEL